MVASSTIKNQKQHGNRSAGASALIERIAVEGRRVIPGALANERKILRDYQMSAVHYLRRHSGGALFVEMRLGKTLVTIRYLQSIGAKRVIIVAPYSAFPSWLRENPSIQRIDRHAPDANYGCQQGWYIVNKEAHLRSDFLSYDWDALVLDESFIKNPKAKVTKYFLRYGPKVPIRILLSGTPAPENELQYYCQLAFLFPGVFDVGNYWEFRARYCRLGRFVWELKPQARHMLCETLMRKCFTLHCKDVNLYPEPVQESRMIIIDLAPYKRAEKTCMDDLGNVLKFAGQKWNYLRRMCSGKEKEQELVELLNGELAGKRVIIWCNYIEECERISRLLKCRYICGQVSVANRAKFVTEDWQYLVIQPETMKFGADLSAADVEIFFSTPLSLLTRQQCERRLVNTNRKYPVLVIDLIAAETLEEDIRESLERKETATQLLERIRGGILRRNG